MRGVTYDNGADTRARTGRRVKLRGSPAARTMPSMKSFFPMVRREGVTLVFLIAFAGFAFIPVWRDLEIGGMAVFGWLIAALMLVSPAVTLVAFLRRRGDSR